MLSSSLMATLSVKEDVTIQPGDNIINVIIWLNYNYAIIAGNIITLDVSTGPAAVSGSRISLRAPGRRGGGNPLCIGKQEVGTYIYSLLYTHTGILGRLLHEVLQPLM